MSTTALPGALRAATAAMVLVPAAVALAPGVAAAPAQVGPQYCTDGDGVTVVVDLRDLDPDAGVIVRCAEGAAGGGYSGFDALRDAGISFQMPARQPGMVCRLVGRPALSEPLPVERDDGYVERCVDAPPTAAYWSYWYAPEGGAWRYSTAGPGNRDVIAGGFEGWSFSLNHSESSAPAPRVAPDNPNAPYEDDSAGQGGGGQGGGGQGDGGQGGDGQGGSGQAGGGQGAGGDSGGGSGDGPGNGPSAGPSAGPASPPATGTTGPPTSGGGPATPDPSSSPPPAGPTGPAPTDPPTTDNPSGAGGSASGRDGGGEPDPRPRGDRRPARAGGDNEPGQAVRAEPDGNDGGTDRPDDSAGSGVVLTGDVPDEPQPAGSRPSGSTLAGVALLAGLAVAGGTLAWRRRTRGDPTA